MPVQVVFDVGANLRLMPRFNEKDPVLHFLSVLQMQEIGLMLQCVLTGMRPCAVPCTWFN